MPTDAKDEGGAGCCSRITGVAGEGGYTGTGGYRGGPTGSAAVMAVHFGGGGV